MQRRSVIFWVALRSQTSKFKMQLSHTDHKNILNLMFNSCSVRTVLASWQVHWTRVSGCGGWRERGVQRSKCLPEKWRRETSQPRRTTRFYPLARSTANRGNQRVVDYFLSQCQLRRTIFQKSTSGKIDDQGARFHCFCKISRWLHMI